MNNRRFFHKKYAKKTNTPAAAAAADKPATAPPPQDDFLTAEYKSNIIENSYLTAKGFTIPKHILHAKDIDILKQELTLKKIEQGNSPVAAGEPEIVYAYRENEKKIYIPRYYAQDRYGVCPPEKSKISAGEEMTATFKGELRDYQKNIVDIYKTAAHSQAVGGGGLISLPCGRGKCLAFGTEILMYDGTIKQVQDIVVGDVIMGDDSTPRNVLTLARGRETMYKVKDLSNKDFNTEYIVNKSHILSLKKGSNIIDISIDDYLNLPENEKDKLYGFRVPIENDMCMESRDFYNLLDLPLASGAKSKKDRLMLFYKIVEKYGSLLWCNTSCNINIIHTDESFINDIIFLVRSVGYTVIKKKKHHIRWFITISTDDSLRNYRISLEKLPENDYYGFEIDGNRRFVLGDFTVTHNTVISIKIATEMRKKTLIIVHKEFLMNQWIERIRDFCGPETTIGRIQGEKMEVEGNDFVIGMLQTLYSRAYPEEVFRPFGLLIIDETHRICSEQFSRALFKFSPRYTLGISATIERKDGLNKILNMFVGDIIYHEERSGDEPVCVRAIEYDAADGDDDYTKVEYDYRGSVKYSTMICKLCDYAPRTEFILRVIADLLEENENQQIMVIAHNKSVLHALYEGIVERNIATVGYYVGGMKEKDLKKTEEKTIVIATYSMAAEALDIKTLSTLVMVTPKTDIIQTVGRILRMKHNQPIVVDIVDSHDVFKNQWRQRRQYYKKCNYSVRYIKSTAYKGMNIDWEKDRTWRWVHAPAAAAAAQPPPHQDPDSGAEDGTGATPAAAPRKCMLNIAALSASVAAAASEKK